MSRLCLAVFIALVAITTVLACLGAGHAAIWCGLSAAFFLLVALTCDRDARRNDRDWDIHPKP